jgi:hypothetical protein
LAVSKGCLPFSCKEEIGLSPPCSLPTPCLRAPPRREREKEREREMEREEEGEREREREREREGEREEEKARESESERERGTARDRERESERERMTLVTTNTAQGFRPSTPSLTALLPRTDFIRTSMYGKYSGSTKLLQTWIILVNVKQHLVQVRRIDAPADHLS